MKNELQLTPVESFPFGGMNTGPLTMSSVEIAELTGKKHQHVMRDIREMLDNLGCEEGLSKSGQSSFEASYINSQGKTQPCYNLPRRECLILVSGYNVQLRAKIIDRWEELEREKASVDFSDPQVLLGVMDHLRGEIARKDEVIEQMKPDVKALERLEAAEGEMCITDAAKTLDVKVRFLFEFMASRRWIYKRAGCKNWVGFADKLQARLLRHDDHIYFDSAGYEKISTRVLVTAKGLVALAKLLDTPLH